VPEVVATARRTGRAELDEHVQGVESAEIDVRLEPGGRPREIVLQEIRDRLSLVPGTNITVGQPISHRIDHMLSGSRANVAVKIFGDDLGVLRALGNQAVSAMQDIPGLVDLALEPQADIPTVRVRFDRAALARHGLPAGQAALALETALLGREVGQIIDGQIAGFQLEEQRLVRIQRPQQRCLADAALAKDTTLDAACFGETLVGGDDGETHFEPPFGSGVTLMAISMPRAPFLRAIS